MEERNANRSTWPNSQTRSRFAEEERANLHCQTPRASHKKEQACTAKLQELRRRKSERALPNSKSFAEEQTLTLTILTLAEPTTLYSKTFHEELALGLWLLQQEGSFHSWIMASWTWMA
jgi:hypothetical protein